MAILHLFYIVFFLPTNHEFGRWKQHLFAILFFTRLFQGIDNFLCPFDNARNTPKLYSFHIAQHPTQIR